MSYIRCLVEQQLPLAHKVILGEAQWSPVQARIFMVLLEKCVGDAALDVLARCAPEEHPPGISRQALEALAHI
jgi:hypothetical protein